MASSITWTTKTVFGNKRVWLGVLTATNGTEAAVTGLKILDSVQITPLIATNMSSCTINAAANGEVALTSGTTGGTYHIMAIGR